MDASIFLRLDEQLATVRPSDAANNLNDLDQAPGVYPTTAAAMAAAIGYGTWTAGWLCDEASGNLAAAFGAPALTPAGTPVYGVGGPLGGADKAVWFDSGTDGFDGGANFDVAAGDDITIAWVGRFLATPVNYGTMFGKVTGAFGQGYAVTGTSGGGLTFAAGAGAIYSSSIADYMVGQWHVGLATIDRATGKLRVGIRGLTSGTSVIGAEGAVAGSLSNAANFTAGLGAWVGANDTFQFAALYIAKGVGAAANLSASLSTGLSNFAMALLTVLPSVVDGVLGRARSFLPALLNGFGAKDLVAGTTLLNRDCSVQAILQWNLLEQTKVGWTLTKAGGLGGVYDAGAASSQKLAGDGYLEVKATETTTQRVIGLSSTNPDNFWTSIEYALNLASASVLQIIESGVLKLTTAYATGDVLQVKRTGTTVAYLKNGIVIYTSATASANPLMIDSSLNDLGATVGGIRLFDNNVQVGVTWSQIAGLAASCNPGTIIARGLGVSAAEFVAFGIELRVVNSVAGIGELRWFWHDLAGVLKTQIGGHFTASSGWIMITATRRWVSPTECTLRYYVGDELLAEVTTADGSIGGGTTGTTSVGTRFTGAKWDRFLAGAIDELRVVPRELTAEEVAATWNRITIYEPLGYTLVKELHAPGFPISKDPSSRVQKETRMWGQALGFAAAQAENVRDNILPDRAYGKILERWEDITKQSPKPGDSIDTRRTRVVGRLRQRAGVSIPGASAALKELVATDPSNLQFLSWDQTIVDAFTALDLQRWDPDPSAQWTINANTLRVQAPAGTYTFDGPTTLWYTCPTTVAADVGNVGGSGTGARILTKLTPTLLPATSEVGVYFGDIVSGNYLLLGLRFDGAWRVVAEAFRAWVSQGAIVEATLGGAPASIWFQLWQQIPAGGAFGAQPATRNYSPAWSITSALTGYTVGANISHISKFQWAGYYLRSVGAIASAVDVALDDLQLRATSSDRPFHWYVYRDPALPGKLDLIGANNVIRGLKHAYTDAKVITSKSLLYDDAASTFDAGPCGAL